MRRKKIESLALYHIKWERGFYGRADNDVTQEFIMLGFRNDNRVVMTHIIPYHPYLKYFRVTQGITSPGFLMVATNNLVGLGQGPDTWWGTTRYDFSNYRMSWEVIKSLDKIDRSELPLYLSWHHGRLFDQLLKGE
jgi:hypothetical protein